MARFTCTGCKTEIILEPNQSLKCPGCNLIWSFQLFRDLKLKDLDEKETTPKSR